MKGALEGLVQRGVEVREGISVIVGGQVHSRIIKGKD